MDDNRLVRGALVWGDTTVTRELDRKEYTIAAVSKLTGVSCHALRVWERRYAFLKPHRSASGHRRYDLGQVQLVRRVSELLQDGHPIRSIMRRLHSGELMSRCERLEQPAEPLHEARSRLLAHLESGDVSGADLLLEQLAGRTDPENLVAHLIEPALVDTGEHWYRRTAHVFQENLASGYLRHKLIGLVEAARARNTQPRGRILLCSIQGDRHEGGILILSFHLEVAGWRAIDLGSDLPTGELVRAVKAWSPEGVCVSFILSRNINKRFDELGQIQDVPVFVGGRSILNYQRLARNHGLVPISGQAKAAVAMVVDRLDAVSRNHHRSSPAASVLVSDA